MASMMYVADACSAVVAVDERSDDAADGVACNPAINATAVAAQSNSASEPDDDDAALLPATDFSWVELINLSGF